MTYLCSVCDYVSDEYDVEQRNGYLVCPECKSEDIEVTNAEDR